MTAAEFRAARPLFEVPGARLVSGEEQLAALWRERHGASGGRA